MKSFKSDRVEEQHQDDDHVGAGGGHGVHGEQHQQWLWFPTEHLSPILPLVSPSREGLWVPEVRHTIYSMESLGRF